MAESNEFVALSHKRKCIDSELDTIVQLGLEARIDTDSYSKFMVSCMDIPRLQDQFDSIQTAIENLELKEKSTLSQEHTDIRSAFNDLIREIKSIKYQLDEQKSESKANTNKIPNIQEQFEGNSVRLPRLSVPQFYGDYRQWKSFSELFKSLIDQDKRLSDVAKFQYLLSAVRGEASKLLRGLPVTGSNYSKAWGILEYNYDNERLIAMQHMDALFKLPSLNVASGSGLRLILTGFIENIGALESMGFPIDKWDFMLYYMLYRKLDPNTRRDFDKSIATNRIPKFKDLREFLDREIIAWESSRASSSRSNISQSNPTTSTSRSHSTTSLVVGSSSQTTKSKTCILCKRMAHSLIACHLFKKKSAFDRFVFAKENKLCLRCLKPMHDSSDAQCAQIRCSMCSASHHNTLLHYAKEKKEVAEVKEETEPLHQEESSSNIVSLYSAEVPECEHTVLLSTAVVMIRDSHGKFQQARALVDPGSEASFVTESLVSRLGLPRHDSGTSIHGIGDVKTRCKGIILTSIKSDTGTGPEYKFRGIVLKQITSDKPKCSLDPRSWSHLSHLVFADPKFYTSSPIDILLGGDIYDEIIVGKSIRGPPGTPMALSTSLGWLLIGKVSLKFVRNRDNASQISSFVISNPEESLDKAIRRFWELESVPEKTILSPEEERCEQIFVQTHKRLKSGRFVVALPFRDGEPSLGESRNLALKRLYSMERRFARDDQFRELYCNFMDDYLETGHMELVFDKIKGNHYFIPHHGVVRPSSTTTKLRTVFDASAVTSEGVSLNDTQLVGPKLQKDVADLVCNFRLHSVAFTADIRQMYRQILVDEKHQNYQLILWRKTLDQEPQVYRLKTVTYGLSSSPFLAIRVLQQLANDHQSEYPKATEVVRHFTYMDDVVSGADSIDSAVQLQTQLFDLLQKGGFELRKWCSNSPEFLQRLPDSAKGIESATVSLEGQHD